MSTGCLAPLATIFQAASTFTSFNFPLFIIFSHKCKSTLKVVVVFIPQPGEVSADFRGHGAEQGPGAGRRRTSYNTGAGGGGHGGRGGRGSAGLRTSYSYDSIYEPTQYGSGGGNGLHGWAGGRGGGRIVFEISEMLRLEGLVHANGEPGSRNSNASGGGAGGSIVIRALNFDGEGTVSVNGGSCFSSHSPYAGGGAGGRIAVYYNGNYTFIGSFQSYGGTSQAEWGGAGTVYTENNRNASRPYRTLRIDNRVLPDGPSRLHEIQELRLAGNKADYPYYMKSYQAPNGIVLTTTGTPYCYRTVNHDSGRCETGNPMMTNLFLTTSNHYYTQDSNPVVTYLFPLPLYLEYLLVYPYCYSLFWTEYYVRIYLSGTEVAGSKAWINPRNCLQGQPGRMDVGLTVDKVTEFLNISKGTSV